MKDEIKDWNSIIRNAAKQLKKLTETTSAGGIATVVGGMAPTFTRDASIYGDDKKKKKKSKKKYANSKD